MGCVRLTFLVPLFRDLGLTWPSRLSYSPASLPVRPPDDLDEPARARLTPCPSSQPCSHLLSLPLDLPPSLSSPPPTQTSASARASTSRARSPTRSAASRPSSRASLLVSPRLVREPRSSLVHRARLVRSRRVTDDSAPGRRMQGGRAQAGRGNQVSERLVEAGRVRRRRLSGLERAEGARGVERKRRVLTLADVDRAVPRSLA